ncbi:T9SS type A sorting domain-containing protein [bacterium]|nr:T9SS type A sorting domain-containing protein [bacterium]
MSLTHLKVLATSLFVLSFTTLSLAKPLEERTFIHPQFEVYTQEQNRRIGPVSPFLDDHYSELDDLGYFTVLHSYEFETDQGWERQLRRGSNIEPGAFWHVDSYEGYNGTNSWWCGVIAPTLPYNGYDNNWLQFLETPILDFSSATSGLTFQFVMKAYLEGGAYHPSYDSWDACNVWYSTDGGITWAVLPGPSLGYNSGSNYAYGGLFGYYYDSGSGMVGTPIPGWYGNITGGNYVAVTFDLSSFIGQPNMKFRFGFASDASESAANYSAYKGMHVDDVSIYDNTTTFLSNNADGVAIPADLIPVEQVDSSWEITEESANSGARSWHIANDRNCNHILASPQFYISSVRTIMSYHVWCDMPDVIGLDNSNLDDYYEILISINNGVSWYNVGIDWSTRPSPGGASLDGWTYRNQCYDSRSKLLDLSPYAGYNARLGFRARSDFDEDNGEGSGLFIDDVKFFQYEGIHEYFWEPAEFAWIELAEDPDAQVLNFTDPSQFANIDLVQSHSLQELHYDNILDHVRVGANGLLYVSGGVSNVVPPDLSSPAANRFGVVAPLWAELSYAGRPDANVYLKNVDGVLVVEWFMLQLDDANGWPVAFEAKMFPDGRIEYHYLNVPDSFEGVEPLLIGVNNVQLTKKAELHPEIGFLPTEGSAVALVPGLPSYGDLEVTVLDESTSQPIPGISLSLPELNLFADTNEEGIASFPHLPFHLYPVVEVEMLEESYFHELIEVPLTANDVATAQILARAFLNPVRNIVDDNAHDDSIILHWQSPNTAYHLANLSLYEPADTLTWYSFDDTDVSQGMDFSIFDMVDEFDLESVDIYLMNPYSSTVDPAHLPPIRVQVWDRLDPEFTTLLFETEFQPTASSGLLSIPLDMIGVESPQFAITVTTPGQQGEMAYNLCVDQVNDYGSDLLIFGATGSNSFVQGSLSGDPVMVAHVQHPGEYVVNLPEPDPVAIGNGMDLRGHRISVVPHTGVYTAPTLSQMVFNPAPIGGSSGNVLDEFVGEVLRYNIYQDGALHGATPDASTLAYMVNPVEEAIHHVYSIAPVYNYDGAEREGVASEPIDIIPVMPPAIPDGSGGATVSQESVSGGLVTINWAAPTLNADGTPLVDLTTYRIYVDGDFTSPLVELGPVEVSQVIEFTRGIHTIYLTALDEAGNESEAWSYGYHWVGLADWTLDFEADDGGLSAVQFEHGAPLVGPVSGANGSSNLWGMNLDGYYENSTLYTLITPSLRVGDNYPWVSFWHWFDFEPGFDGGMVVVSTDAGATWDIVDMADDASLYQQPFLGAGYDNPLSNYGDEASGVISGQSSASTASTQEGWLLQGINLAEYSGMDVTLGFVGGTDAANNLYPGWYIDDVSFCDLTFSPAAFHLISPAEPDTSWVLENELLWHASTDPNPGSQVRYDAFLDTLPTMTTKWSVGTELVDTMLAINELEDDRTYYWTIRTIISSGAERWAEDTLSFVTYLPEPPESFSRLIPDSNCVIDQDTLVFTWSAAYDPDPGDVLQYHFRWRTSEEWSDTTTVDTNLRLSGLEDDQQYFWSIGVVDRFGNETECSSYETGWPFTTHFPEMPQPFALISPADQTELPRVDMFPLLFDWNTAVDPDPGDTLSYELQLSTEESFTDPLVLDAGTADSLEVESLEQNTYFWRVKACDLDGLECFSSDTWTLNVTLAVEDPWSGLPSEYSIAELYPNPFNPSLTIVIGLPDAGELAVELFNSIGQQVATIARGHTGAGYHHFVFDGSSMASGVYFVHASLPGKLNQVRKVVLMK